MPDPYNRLTRHSVVDGITAFAGGGQASATLLTAYNNRITVVATIADSVKLPPAVVAGIGQEINVYNTTANSANVFPSTGDQVKALGANTAFALAGGKSARFTQTATGQWEVLLSA